MTAVQMIAQMILNGWASIARKRIVYAPDGNPFFIIHNVEMIIVPYYTTGPFLMILEHVIDIDSAVYVRVGFVGDFLDPLTRGIIEIMGINRRLRATGLDMKTAQAIAVIPCKESRCILPDQIAIAVVLIVVAIRTYLQYVELIRVGD